jgi:hypothetical protein
VNDNKGNFYKSIAVISRTITYRKDSSDIENRYFFKAAIFNRQKRRHSGCNAASLASLPSPCCWLAHNKTAKAKSLISRQIDI